jgi:glycine dehydrogenase
VFIKPLSFDTHCRKTDAKRLELLQKNEINFFYIDDETISSSLNETTLLTDIDQVIAVLRSLVGKALQYMNTQQTKPIIQLTYPDSRMTLNNHHSETSLMPSKDRT